jgi:hypothetical protein
MTDTSHFSEIADLCNRVYRFQALQNWRFKALPVISWEFPDVGEFFAARAMLERAINASRQPFAVDMIRLPDRSTVEMDVCGVTFRLSCPAIYTTADGQHRGVNELRYGTDYMTNQTPPNPGMK